MVILNPSKKHTVSKENVLYKCGWSPFEDHTFSSTPTHTFINGDLVYENGNFAESFRGKSLEFER
jgi:dihydroorotase